MYKYLLIKFCIVFPNEIYYWINDLLLTIPSVHPHIICCNIASICVLDYANSLCVCVKYAS